MAKGYPAWLSDFELENPGMHATDTVDYDIVLEGEITLEVDGGQARVLTQGDIAIQYGARHAWRNHSEKPATPDIRFDRSDPIECSRLRTVRIADPLKVGASKPGWRAWTIVGFSRKL